MIGRRPPEAVSGDIRVVEARIARELARLTDVSAPDERDRTPPAYVRRHLVEHAAAGGILTSRIVPDPFVPYLDPVRLRAVAAEVSAEAFPLLHAVRQATTVRLWDLTTGATIGTVHTGHGEGIAKMITAELPDGQAVAMTCGWGGSTVGVWRLPGGEPVGQPLTMPGHVWAMATATLPDRRVVAVAGDSAGTAARLGPGDGHAAPCPHRAPGRAAGPGHRRIRGGRRRAPSWTTTPVRVRMGWSSGRRVRQDRTGVVRGSPAHGPYGRPRPMRR